MVARAGGHYSETSRGFWGVTQGDPLSPTIFNVVVDAVVCNWIFLKVGGAGGTDRWGREVLHRSAFFYADNIMVVSNDTDWLQGAFDTLTWLFDMVGIHINIGKTVGIICHPFRAVRTQLEATYEQCMTGEGITYRDRQRLWVQLQDSGAELVVGLFAAHCQTQHIVGLGYQRENPPPPPQGRPADALEFLSNCIGAAGLTSIMV